VDKYQLPFWQRSFYKFRNTLFDLKIKITRSGFTPKI